MTPDEIKQALSSDSDEVRRRAAIALMEHREASVAPLLLRALGDDSWRVREEAVRVGSELSPAVDVVADLVEAICQGENVGLRNSALALLGALGPSAHERLKQALAEVDPGARKFVLEALAAAGGEGVVKILIGHLHSGDANMVAAALDALAVVGGPDGEAALRGVLIWDDAFQRMAAMDALNRIDALVPWDELSRLLSDRLVFRVALPALGRCGDARAILPLVSALSETSARVLADAVSALANLLEQMPEALPALSNGLDSIGTDARSRIADLDERHSLAARQGAAIVLCLCHDTRGLDAVLRLMTNDVLFPTLQRALQEWGDGAIERLLEDFVSPGATEAPAALDLAASLVQQAPSSVAEALLSRLQSELRKGLYGADPDLQVVAVRAIGPWAQAADAVPLVAAATSQDYELAHGCSTALTELAEREPDAVRDALSQAELSGPGLEAVAALVVSLDGPRALRRFQAALLLDDPAIRCAALTGLSTLGGARATDLIAVALTDPSLDVQLVAAAALGDLPGGLGVPTLLLCLDGSPPELRAAVARALGETGSDRAVEPLMALMESSTNESAVQVSGLASLCKLQAPGLRRLLVTALEASDVEVVKEALVALANAPPDGLEYLVNGLSDPRWDVRQLAVRLVFEAGHPDALSLLEAREVEERDDLVQAELAEALGRLRGVA